MSRLNFKLLISTFVVLGASTVAVAQNPVIRDQFTADPTAKVFNNRMYIYPSHDIPSPVERLKEWFCMADYHVFSSDNLTDWEDHGVILDQKDVPWGNPEGYSMWAPDCVYKNGNYYFYFPNAPKEGRGFNIGVAVSQNPEGPFMAMPRPIEGVMGIDPCVLVDDDGSSYIYWSGMGMRGARLADNMMQLVSEPVVIEGLPEGFKEGPFVFKREGKYYFTFPWVRNETETLAYAMSDSPLGPYEFKGLIMAESPTGCWTNHHSLVEWNGQWYLFYHHNDYSPDFDKNRSVRIDSISFNPDGTIVEVVPTLRGVGVSNARDRVQIDRYSDISPKSASIDYINRANPFEGWKTVMSRRGAWVRYNKVDFGQKPVTHVTARVKAPKGGTLSVYADDMTKGNLISTIKLPAANDWQEIQTAINGHAPLNLHDLFVQHGGGGKVEIDWIGFDALPWEQGAFKSGVYRNVFSEMGYSDAEINGKLQAIYDSLFHGSNRIYFEVGDSLAYISDIKNKDVRTEGMSYGMMIAVQLDKKDVFDRLWRWSKRYMQHQDGDREGYFAWSCRTDGTRNSQGAASDGELYYITSLIFASNRWGNDTGINYLGEAQRIINSSMLKVGKSHAAPLINVHHKLITFTPDNWGGRFTDPSYHVPAFYEVWALYLNDGRSDFWHECAQQSRNYLRACIHPVTGLNPDYSNYDGSLVGSRGVVGDAFRFDSWRVPMNIALDYSWSCADRDWQREYGNRIQNFLYSQGIDDFVDQFNVDGTPVDRILEAGGYRKLRHSLGLVATSAAVSLACTDMKSREFVDRLWNSRHEPYDDGYFDAYYDGLLRLFSFMHLSGNYRIIEPSIS